MTVQCRRLFAVPLLIAGGVVGCGKESVEQNAVSQRSSSDTAATKIAKQDESAVVDGKALGEISEISDSQRIIGTWKSTAAISDGKDTTFGTRINYEFGKETFVGGEMEFQYSLDPTTNPKEIDFYPMYFDEAGAKVASRVPQRGIYRLDGDALQICHSISSRGPRPVRFEGLKNDGNELLVFERLSATSSLDENPK